MARNKIGMQINGFDELMAKINDGAKFYCNSRILKADSDKIVADFTRRLEDQGFSLDDYLVMSKKTKEDIENEAHEQAYKNAKNAYVLDKIGIVENINVTEEEVNAKLAVFASQYKTTIEEVKKQL